MAMAATFPTSPKAVATKISQAVQVSLQVFSVTSSTEPFMLHDLLKAALAEDAYSQWLTPETSRSPQISSSIVVGYPCYSLSQDRKQRLQISTPQALCFGIGGKQTGLQILGDPNASPGSGVRQALRCHERGALLACPYTTLRKFLCAHRLAQCSQAYKDATVCVMKDAKAAKLARKEWAKLPLTPADVRADVPTSKCVFDSSMHYAQACGENARVSCPHAGSLTTSIRSIAMLAGAVELASDRAA
eukprot:1273345-Pleurochrysis_carterae.AAC.7